MIFTSQMRSLRLMNVLAQCQFICGNLKSSLFEFRFILNIFKARKPKFGEKSNAQKELMVLRYN